MDTLLMYAVVLVSGVGLIGGVFRYLAAGESEEHPYLGAQVLAGLERSERYSRLPEPVFDMNRPEFEEYIAGLCRRDGCTDVRRGMGDRRGGDMTGCLPDGRKVAVKCKRECEDSSWTDFRDIRSIDDAARTQLGADVAVFVVLGPITERGRKFAARRRLTLIDADRLEAWMRGTTLSALLEPQTGRRGANRPDAQD